MTSLAYKILDIPEDDVAGWRSDRDLVPGEPHLRLVPELVEDEDVSPEPAASEDSRPARVLIAEDDAEMRTMLAEEFKAAGYQVFEVPDGKKLFQCIKSQKTRPMCPEPDLIVSDIRMPGLSGLEVLRFLRRSDWTMPVIMITAFGDKQTHEEAKKLGAAAVMDKPFDVENLVDAAQSLVPAEV